MTFIYALVDPRTNERRYIGKADSPENRLKRHMRELRGSTHKINWLKQLKKMNITPNIEILEECDKSVWAEREIYWVAYGKRCNWPLTNGSNGGEGRLGSPASIETRIKQSLAKKGKPRPPISEEQRTRLSLSKQGSKNPMYGKKQSEETKRKRSQSMSKYVGEMTSGAKLTRDSVLEIRRLLCTDTPSKSIAEMFNVSEVTISNIKHRRSWNWLP